MRYPASEPLASIGEYALHDYIRSFYASEGVLLDDLRGDCGVVSAAGGSGFSISADWIPSRSSKAEWGELHVAQNVSDVLASGAEPVGILSGIRYPSDARFSDVTELIQDIARACKQFGVGILGGDLKPGQRIDLFGVGVGRLPAGKPQWRRFTARPGDVLVLTRSGANGVARRWANIVAKSIAPTPNGIEFSWIEERVELTLPLESARFARGSLDVTASMDLSDGLGAALVAMCQNSKLGLQLDRSSLERFLSDEALHLASYLKIPSWAWSFAPGYDWECAFAVRGGVELGSTHSVCEHENLVAVGQFDGSGRVTISERETPSSLLLGLSDQKFVPRGDGLAGRWLDAARDLASLIH